jgi:hypothetical protein
VTIPHTFKLAIATPIWAPPSPLRKPTSTLGIKAYLNGVLVSNIVLDTSQTASDTIDYVATDQTGLTATPTRAVIVEASPSIVLTDAASTTATTTTP